MTRISVKDLFLEICDLPEEERQMHLARSGANELQIREVNELIHALQPSTSALTQFSRSGISQLIFKEAARLREGSQLGPWKIVSPIAEGGMGAIYLAARADGHFEQRAAIKVLNEVSSSVSEEWLSQERQILARLSHPNINKLLDGGSTDDGHPYLVMEYIDGESIDAYCRNYKLNIQEVISLFLMTCNAVAFAHRQLILHCDIKPSNVMVNTEGQIVLVDFGIATLVREPTGSHALGRAYSASFASPEQIQGGVLTTASDVFSLGALLRTLTQSYDINVSLRSIIDKAMQEAPEVRYQSVEELTSDLLRYKANQPVSGLAGKHAYVAGLFIKRNAIAIGIALSITLMTGFSINRIVSARTAAETERDRALNATELAERERLVANAARRQAEVNESRANAQTARALQAEQEAKVARVRALASAEAERKAAQVAAHEQFIANAKSSWLSSVLTGPSIENYNPVKTTAAELIAAAASDLEKAPVAKMPDVARAELALMLTLYGQNTSNSALVRRFALLTVNLLKDISPSSDARLVDLKAQALGTLARLDYSSLKFTSAANFAREYRKYISLDFKQQPGAAPFESRLTAEGFMTLIESDPRTSHQSYADMDRLIQRAKLIPSEQSRSETVRTLCVYKSLMATRDGNYGVALNAESCATSEDMVVARIAPRSAAIAFRKLNLGIILVNSGASSEGITALREAQALQDRSDDAPTSIDAVAELFAARSYSDLRMLPEELSAASRSLELNKKVFGADSVRAANAKMAMARAFLHAENIIEADRLSEEATQTFAQTFELDPWYRHQYSGIRAMILARSGRTAEALELATKAISEFKKMVSVNHSALINLQLQGCWVHIYAGDRAAAHACVEGNALAARSTDPLRRELERLKDFVATMRG